MTVDLHAGSAAQAGKQHRIWNALKFDVRSKKRKKLLLILQPAACKESIGEELCVLKCDVGNYYDGIHHKVFLKNSTFVNCAESEFSTPS